MSPKRGSLAGMLPAATDAPPLPVRQPEAIPESRTPEVGTSEVRSPQVPRSGQAPSTLSRSRTSRVPQSTTPELPKYKRLERKDVLAWPGQITQLSILARALNRSRDGRGERLTDNTLIRVAMDLLLDRADELAGTTEDELRASLGLPAREG